MQSLEAINLINAKKDVKSASLQRFSKYRNARQSSFSDRAILDRVIMVKSPGWGDVPGGQYARFLAACFYLTLNTRTNNI